MTASRFTGRTGDSDSDADVSSVYASSWNRNGNAPAAYSDALGDMADELGLARRSSSAVDSANTRATTGSSLACR